VNVCIDAIHAQVLVGQKVQVFDSIEFTWCDGQVQEYDPATKLHKVVRQPLHFLTLWTHGKVRRDMS